LNDLIHEVKLSPNGKLILAYTKVGALDGFPQIIIISVKTRKKIN